MLYPNPLEFYIIYLNHLEKSQPGKKLDLVGLSTGGWKKEKPYIVASYVPIWEKISQNILW